MLIFYINRWVHGQYHVVEEGRFPDQGHMLIPTTHGRESQLSTFLQARGMRECAFPDSLNRYMA